MLAYKAVVAFSPPNTCNC